MNNYTNQQTNSQPRSKRGIIKIVIIVALIIIAAALFLISPYNKLVKHQEATQNAWSQVENQYQRRADLIPNLVETVKGYASHERETLEGVINARAKATQTTVDAENLTPETLAQFNNSQQELTSALSRLMVVVERYPELKADENFRQLQAQLEGTENRISTARMDFNNTAKEYNTYRRRFPTNIAAGIFGFHKYPYFEAQEDAKNAPSVKF